MEAKRNMRHFHCSWLVMAESQFASINNGLASIFSVCTSASL
uniref:Uncharacterized protein n=1 Tax=Anguilla anguilla TaxID=7936 RepID=A0A0E9RAU4_ANGAN